LVKPAIKGQDSLPIGYESAGFALKKAVSA
jgi:hypothetical protein